MSFSARLSCAAMLCLCLAAPATAQVSLFPTLTPQSSSVMNAYELGPRISSVSSGRITTIKFWKLADDKGTHVGKVWDATGKLLTSVTFVNETASGWQQQLLLTPFVLAANTIVTVSVNVNKGGHFAVIANGLAKPITVAPLTALDSRSSNSGFPSGQSPHNYFRDIVFVADPVPTLTIAPITTPSAMTPLSVTLMNGPTAQVSVDGKVVTSTSTSQFATAVDLSTLSAGQHTLTVSVLGVTSSSTFNIGPQLVMSYLSDLPWISAVGGWGPVERDKSNGEQAAGDGNVLTINGVTYAKGLGTHAASDIKYALAGQCKSFAAFVGVDAEEMDAGSVDFQVQLDGVTKFDSGMVAAGIAPIPVAVDITNAQTLDLLVTDAGDGISNDHADWADAKIACLPDTTPPTVVSTSPAAGATTVGTSTNVSATFSEAMAPLTLSNTTVALKQGATTVLTTVTYDVVLQTVTLVLSAPLATNTAYTVSINGATDRAGNKLVPFSWTFTTANTVVVGVPINPGQDIQSIVNANPVGTTFTLKSGVHRMQTITPKSGDTFIGEIGTIISGAKVLAGATGNGPWVYTGQTQEGTFDDAGGAAYQAGHDASGHPEDLFFDNVLKQHVGTLAEGVSGTWFFDYPNDTIYVFDNPAGHVVETSVTPTAISSASTQSTFQSLTIEKYASLTQQAAIVLGNGATIKNCEVRWNHYAGIETGPGAIADTNFVHHNGVFGFIGSGNPLVVNNEISYNNTVFGDSFWGAGGSKWVYANGLIVRGNFSHHNLGPGLWTDINNINVLYENNRIEDNLRAGIVHEISYDAVIRNNQIARNGTGHFYPGWPTEGGIAIIDSRNVEVYGNTLTDNWGGIGALQDNRAATNPDQNNGLWEMRNFNVHDNTVNQKGAIQVGAGMTGIIGPDGMTALFTSMGNTFTTNHYALGANPNYFLWSAGATNETAWKAAGQDTGGTFTR